MLANVTGAFLIGLLAGSAFPYTPLLCIGMLLLAAMMLTWLERSKQMNPYRGSALYSSLLAGMLYWAGYAWFIAPIPLSLLTSKSPTAIAGHIVAPAHYAPGRASMTLAVDQISGKPVHFRRDGILRVTWREPDLSLRQGDLVTFTAKIHTPSGHVNPGGFDYADYLLMHGVDATSSVSGPGAVRLLGSASSLSRWSLWSWIDEQRDIIRHAALASLHNPALGIYLGIIVGQPGYLDSMMRDAFMATGTVHILSISGSHLGLVAILSFYLIKHTFRRLPSPWLLRLSRYTTATRMAALGTVIPVTVYALLAGAEVATIRSWIMLVVFLLAVWLGRKEQLTLSLACAALAIVLHDPRALYDISFQLSFCSVLAIALVLHDPTEEGREGLSPAPHIRKRVGTWLATYAGITGGITLATLPLVAYHFNQVTWLGLAANLVVVPLAGLLLVPLGLGSALWVAATGQATLPLASLNQFGYQCLSDLVQVMARLPGAEWHVASPTIASIVLFYGLLLAAINLRPHRRIQLACLTSALCLAAWWLYSPRLWPHDGSLRVTFLDVGQGDASVIELPDGETILIDAGTKHDTLDIGRSVVAPYLWDRGIFHLDHVIATHPQLDHVGGLPAVIRHFHVGRYWSNGLARQEPFYQELQRAIRLSGLAESVAMEGQPIIADGPCNLTVLNPAAEAQTRHQVPTNTGSMLNNQSVVTRLTCDTHSFLFTADAEAPTLARLSELATSVRTRVVKVPHHGASSSLEQRWIGHVAPEIAVISVGNRNIYGHPS
ncbi:MAG: DNA internalization-related competence protein ComEC/Rec2, partial [Nitrospiraceae bacterium]